MKQTLHFKRCVLIFIFLLSVELTFSQEKNVITDDDLVFIRTEIPPAFPGGDSAWKRYVTEAFKTTDIKFTNIDQGTCRVRFIVDKNGAISEVVALTMRGTLLAKFGIQIISAGPRWNPAKQNGHLVRCYQEQPIILTLTEK